MEKKKTERRFIYKTPLFYSLPIFLFILCALSTTPCPSGASLDIRRSSIAAAKADLFHFQGELEKTVEKKGRDEEMVRARARASSRRYLSGPGSWPPRCTSKCGKCTPCKPVHVPVPPGTPVTAEYYPEAWRCKCGNKLYMP